MLVAGTLSSSAQDRKGETMIDEHFSVTDGGMLEVNASDADVVVTSGKALDVHVTVVLEARDMARARAYYERQHITAAQNGNTVRVNSDPERYSNNWRDWRDHPHIVIQVVVPEVFNVDLRSSDGDLSLERLRGNVHMKTSDGDVSTGELEGNRVEIRTSDGDVNTRALSGKTIEIATSDGDLLLGDISADHLVARTSDGNISTSAVSGDAEIKTSDGDITVTAFHGPSLHVRTSDGSIRVDRVDARTSRAHASDGQIHLKGVDGDVEAVTSSGDIHLELRKPGAIMAKTSDGDVMIDVPEGHAADVRLRGDVQMAHAGTFDGQVREDRADGRINGGGPLIEATSSDGAVSLKMR